MAEEKREEAQDKEVQDILCDLDAILSELGGEPGLAAAPSGEGKTAGACEDGGSLAAAPPPSQPVAEAFPSVPPPLKPAVPASAPAVSKPSQPVESGMPIVLGPRPMGAKAPPPAQSVAEALPSAPLPLKPAVPAPAPAVSKPSEPAESGMPIVLGPRPLGAKAPPPAQAVAKALPSAPLPLKPAVPAPAPAGPDEPLEKKPDASSGSGFAARPPIELKLEGGLKAEAPVRVPLPAKGECQPADTIPEAALPDKIGKDQIRRVAFLYRRQYEAERDAFVKLLDHTAKTVPKKPLFLRWVLYQQAAPECGIQEIISRVAQARAVAVLGMLEGFSEAKLRELGDSFGGAGLMFRVVAPLDAGKKSLAVDVIVDMMLLPHE